MWLLKLVVLSLSVCVALANVYYYGWRERGDTLLDETYNVQTYFFNPAPVGVIHDYKILITYKKLHLQIIYFQDATFRITQLKVEFPYNVLHQPRVTDGGIGQQNIRLQMAPLDSTNNITLYGFRIWKD